MLVREAIVTALDFETTGRCRGQASLPWQLGMAEATNGVISQRKSLYLRVPSTHHFNPYTPGRWGELREVLDQSHTLQEEWSNILPLLANRWLISHNAPVERSILKEAFPLHEFPCWIDTLRVSRAIFPNLESYSLSDLLIRLNLYPFMEQTCPGLEPHDALFDAVGCIALLQFIISQDGWMDVTCDYLSNL